MVAEGGRTVVKIGVVMELRLLPGVAWSLDLGEVGYLLSPAVAVAGQTPYTYSRKLYPTCESLQYPALTWRQSYQMLGCFSGAPG